MRTSVLNKRIVFCVLFIYALISFSCSSVELITYELKDIAGDPEILNERANFIGILGPCKPHHYTDLYFFIDKKECHKGNVKKAAFIDLGSYCKKNECDSFRGKKIVVEGVIKKIDDPAVNTVGLTKITTMTLFLKMVKD